MLRKTLLKDVWMTTRAMNIPLARGYLTGFTRLTRIYDKHGGHPSVKEIFLGLITATAGLLGYETFHRLTSSDQDGDADEDSSVPSFSQTETAKHINGQETAKSTTIGHGNAANKARVRLQRRNYVLEQALRDAMTAAVYASYQGASELAMATEKMDDYALSLMCALEEPICGDDRHLSQAASEARDIQASVRRMADSKMEEANKALKKYQEVIRKGRADPATANNTHLAEAEETLMKLQAMLDKASVNAHKSLEKLKLTQQIGEAIEEYKKQLIEEVNEMLPEGKSFTNLKALTTDDLHLIIYLAHRRIKALHRELSLIQVSDNELAERFRQQMYRSNQDDSTNK